MSTTYRASRRLCWVRAILTVLGGLGFISAAYRIHRASDLSLTDLITSVASVVLLSGALIAGWVMHVRAIRSRTGSTDLQVARARREQRLREEEERSWWADPVDEDTVGFGPNVRVFPAHRKTHSRAG